MVTNLRRLIIALILLGLLGFAVFRLEKEGKLPLNLDIPTPGAPLVTSNQTRIVVQEENAVIDTVEKTSPSVVAIGINQRLINPFNPLDVPTNRQSTIGTGFIVSSDGIIITNRHVVADPNGKYSVVTKDGKRLEIARIYRDPALDLAIVKVNASGLTALELGDSSKLKVGQLAIAIGNALGRFDNTVTTGVVSGLGRSVIAGDPFAGDLEQLDNLIQTDAAINPGNSGGPLLNSAAQVIGVNVATTEGAQNIGFAIPIDSVKSLINEFKENGTISRPYLGIRYRLVTRDVAILNEVPQGAYVQEVLEDSPAEGASIQAGDIITKIDNQTINTDTKVSEVIQNKKVGDKITLEVWSDGQTKNVTATLEQSPGL